METGSSNTMVPTYWTTLYHIPDKSDLQYRNYFMSGIVICW